ncbi:MAG: hypothetical protein ABEJ31_06055 [Haloarculaceae archaeon]
MNVRNFLLVAASGIAALLLVGVAVTELAAPAIEFSLFLGIPAGVAAGLGVAGLVAVGLGATSTPARRRASQAVGTFGLTFLVVLLVFVWPLSTSPSTALAAAAIAALLTAIGAYWQSSGADARADDRPS